MSHLNTKCVRNFRRGGCFYIYLFMMVCGVKWERQKWNDEREPQNHQRKVIFYVLKKEKTLFYNFQLILTFHSIYERTAIAWWNDRTKICKISYFITLFFLSPRFYAFISFLLDILCVCCVFFLNLYGKSVILRFVIVFFFVS